MLVEAALVFAALALLFAVEVFVVVVLVVLFVFFVLVVVLVVFVLELAVVDAVFEFFVDAELVFDVDVVVTGLA